MSDRQDRPIRAYFGHHKCASTWIWNIFAQVSYEAGLRHLLVLDEMTPTGCGPLYDRASLTDEEGMFDRSTLRARADETAADVVSCITADRRQLEVLRPYRAFHVVRDPRDIVVSAYFSHRNSHPTGRFPQLVAHRAALRDVSPSEGLFLEMEFSAKELRELDEWNYDDDRVLELNISDLVREPYQGFVTIFRHLELLGDEEPTNARAQLRAWSSRLRNRLASRRGLGALRREILVTGELLLGTVYARRFEAQTRGRPRGTENVASHYRKGVPGDWINHFSVEHAEAFDQKYGELLIKLGLEHDHSWVERLEVARAAA